MQRMKIKRSKTGLIAEVTASRRLRKELCLKFQTNIGYIVTEKSEL